MATRRARVRGQMISDRSGQPNMAIFVSVGRQPNGSFFSIFGAQDPLSTSVALEQPAAETSRFQDDNGHWDADSVNDPFETDGASSESSASAGSDFSDDETAGPGQGAAPRQPGLSEAAVAGSDGEHPAMQLPPQAVGQIGGPPPELLDAMKARTRSRSCCTT